MKTYKKSSFVERYREWASDEKGMSEVAGAIFVLPFVAFLIFALVECGVNMRYRILVENINQSTVQGISNDGALYWTRTSRPPITQDNTWEADEQRRLQELCGSAAIDGAGSHCTQPPTADCVVADGAAVDYPPSIQVAREAGDNVRCTATFYYKTVSPLSNTPFTSVGFSYFFHKPIVQTAYGKTVVGFSGG